MAEKSCPFYVMGFYANSSNQHIFGDTAGLCIGDNCRLWQNGDCGLKVARESRAQIISDIFGLNADFEKLEKLGFVKPLHNKPDRWKEAWKELRSGLYKIHTVDAVEMRMRKIETEMGGKDETT